MAFDKGISYNIYKIKTLLRNNSKKIAVYILITSTRNGNLEVPVFFFKAKQGYTARK